MPYNVKKVGGKYRIFKAGSGKVAKNKGGTAMDGGGHDTPAAAHAQIKAVEMSEKRRGK